MKQLYSYIGYNLEKYEKKYNGYLKRQLEPYGLNVAEFMALLSLYRNNGKTQDEILKDIHGKNHSKELFIGRINYDKSIMTRTMQALEKQGYVKREKNPNDGRSYIFCIRKEVEALKPKLIDILKYWCDEAFADISKEDLEMFSTILDKINDNIDKVGDI